MTNDKQQRQALDPLLPRFPSPASGGVTSLAAATAVLTLAAPLTEPLKPVEEAEVVVVVTDGATQLPEELEA